MPQIGNQLPVLPGAVRNNEIEQATFFARVLFLEQSLRIPRKFEQSQAFFKVGLIGRLMPLDFAQATILLGAPLSGHAIEKCAIHLAVELVHVHGMHAALEPVVFGPQPTDSRIMLALLLGVAGAKRVAHPSEDFLVKCQAAKQLREPLSNDLLADVGLLASALISRAMVIDVALLLDLADDRAPAVPAGDQPRKGKIVLHTAMLLGVAAIQNTLHALPQITGDKRLMLPLIHTPIPLELAHIEPIAQRGVNRAYRHRRPALAIDEPGRSRLLGCLFQGQRPGRVPFEKSRNDRPGLRIGFDDLLAIGSSHIAIAKRRHRWPNALLGLLLHTLARFLGQVVDVVLRHQHLDAVHELFRRARSAPQHHAFLDEVDFDLQVVHRHPIL